MFGSVLAEVRSWTSCSDNGLFLGRDYLAESFHHPVPRSAVSLSRTSGSGAVPSPPRSLTCSGRPPLPAPGKSWRWHDANFTLVHGTTNKVYINFLCPLFYVFFVIASKARKYETTSFTLSALVFCANCAKFIILGDFSWQRFLLMIYEVV